MKTLIWLWQYKTLAAMAALVVALFSMWVLADLRAAKIKKLNDRITLLQTVVTEYENAQRELEGKAHYDRNKSKTATESAIAVATGRQNGDGPMAPVLRAEYERVHGLAVERSKTRTR